MLTALELDERQAVAPTEPRERQTRVGERGCRVDELVAPPELAFAEQGERDVGEVGEVACAQRAELAGERRQPGIERVDEAVEQFCRDPGAARSDLVGPRHHRRTNDLRVERWAGATGMASQQAQRVLLAPVLRYPVGAQRAHSGRDAVQLVAAGQQGRDRLPGTVVVGVRLRRECRGCAVARYERDTLGGERRAVEDDRRAPVSRVARPSRSGL